MVWYVCSENHYIPTSENGGAVMILVLTNIIVIINNFIIITYISMLSLSTPSLSSYSYYPTCKLEEVLLGKEGVA